MTAGTSGKPLVEKLGIRRGDRILWVNAPEHLQSLLGPLPADVEIVTDQSTTDLDYIHVFATERQQLAEWLPGLRERMKAEGMLWASWPKQSSPRAGELRENVVREVGIDNQLVDVKVAAIDEDWSGLKFVIRLRDRPQMN